LSIILDFYRGYSKLDRYLEHLVNLFQGKEPVPVPYEQAVLVADTSSKKSFITRKGQTSII
jgi:hypothetical protein